MTAGRSEAAKRTRVVLKGATCVLRTKERPDGSVKFDLTFEAGRERRLGEEAPGELFMLRKAARLMSDLLRDAKTTKSAYVLSFEATEPLRSTLASALCKTMFRNKRDTGRTKNP